jgi:hypothetical protein
MTYGEITLKRVRLVENIQMKQKKSIVNKGRALVIRCLV